MVRRIPLRKVSYFGPVVPRLARNTVIESTFEVGRRYRCMMRIDCGQLVAPFMPTRLDQYGSSYADQ